MKTRSLATAGAIAACAAGVAAPATAGAAAAATHPNRIICTTGYYWSAKTSEQAFIPTNAPLSNVLVPSGQRASLSGTLTRSTSESYTLSQQLGVNGDFDIVGIQFGASSSTTGSAQWQRTESSSVNIGTNSAANPLPGNALPYLFVEGTRTVATLYEDNYNPNDARECSERRVRSRTVFLPSKSATGVVGWVSAEVRTPYAVTLRYSGTPVNR